MLDKFFNGSTVAYGLTILFTGIVSVIDALGQVGMQWNFILNLFSKLPLYSKGLGWVVPALIGIVFGTIYKLVEEKISYSKVSEL